MKEPTNPRVDRITKVCPSCGTEFKVLPCCIDRKYCSNKCVGIANCGDGNPAKRPEVRQRISDSLMGHNVSDDVREKLREFRKDLWSGDKNPACRPEIAKKISGALMGHEVPEDIRQKIRENMPDQSMEKNGNWQGGLSFEPYCPKFTDKLKQQIRDQYDNCDFISGLPDYICNIVSGRVQKLSVHHVDYNKMQGCDGHKWGLIPLSRSNHAKTHGNRSFWNKLVCYALEYDEIYYNEEIIDIFTN